MDILQLLHNCFIDADWVLESGGRVLLHILYQYI